MGKNKTKQTPTKKQKETKPANRFEFLQDLEASLASQEASEMEDTPLQTRVDQGRRKRDKPCSDPENDGDSIDERDLSAKKLARDDSDSDIGFAQHEVEQRANERKRMGRWSSDNAMLQLIHSIDDIKEAMTRHLDDYIIPCRRVLTEEKLEEKIDRAYVVYLRSQKEAEKREETIRENKKEIEALKAQNMELKNKNEDLVKQNEALEVSKKALQLQAARAVQKEKAKPLKGSGTAPGGPVLEPKEQSYAAATKQNIKKRGPERHVVTVYPQNKGTDSKRTIETLKKCFNPSSNQLQIKAIREIEKGGVLVETTTKDDIDKLIKSVNDTKKGLTAGIPPKKPPKMIIYNTPEMTGEQLLAALKTQNSDLLTDEEIQKIKPLFKTGKGTIKNWVVETPPSTRDKFKNKRRLFLGWHACHVRDYVVAGRCFRCQAFGHIAKHCRATKDICGHCAHEGHSFKECPNKTKEPTCINCKKAKRPHKHSSRADECPAYKRAVEMLISKTDYGDP